MLTESAYITAIVVYVLAALAALWLLHRWLLRGVPLAPRLLLLFLAAALLLTPAYTQPGGETMAPALVVGAFQWLTAGAEGAEHALRPLGIMAALAGGAALVLAVLVRVLRRPG